MQRGHATADGHAANNYRRCALARECVHDLADVSICVTRIDDDGISSVGQIPRAAQGMRGARGQSCYGILGQSFEAHQRCVILGDEHGRVHVKSRQFTSNRAGGRSGQGNQRRVDDCGVLVFDRSPVTHVVGNGHLHIRKNQPDERGSPLLDLFLIRCMETGYGHGVNAGRAHRLNGSKDTSEIEPGGQLLPHLEAAGYGFDHWVQRGQQICGPIVGCREPLGGPDIEP